MLKKFLFAAGFGLGALFVYALTHDVRQYHKDKTTVTEGDRNAAKYFQRSLAERSAIEGVDYLSEEYWEERMKEFQPWIDAVRRGDPDADRFME